jgi:hypothetical protein
MPGNPRLSSQTDNLGFGVKLRKQANADVLAEKVTFRYERRNQNE